MDFETSSPADPLAQSDAQVWSAVIAGQTEALGILYDRHAALVYGIARQVLGNVQEAEDLTQDVFLNLAKNQGYNPQRGSLRTYLAILTRSRAIDRVRSRRSQQLSLQNPPPDLTDFKSPLPMESVSQRETHQDVQAALEQLSDSQQQILRMAYYDGLSQATIAEQLQTPLGTVKARARRGLLKLRQSLQDYLDE